MGGTLGFTLRQANGEQFRMSRWTNWCPWAIDNLKLVKKRSRHIYKIKKEWVESLQKPKKDRHWAYSHPYLAPTSGYGLVVVDLLKNKLLDCNGYHHFGKMLGITLKNEYRAGGLADFQSDGEHEAARFFKFYQEKRIKDVLSWKDGNFFSIQEDINSWPIEKIVGELINIPDPVSFFVLDMSPLEVTTFPETPAGFADFRQAVLSLGFKLSKKEESLWDEKINPTEE